MLQFMRRIQCLNNLKIISLKSITVNLVVIKKPFFAIPLQYSIFLSAMSVCISDMRVAKAPYLKHKGILSRISLLPLEKAVCAHHPGSLKALYHTAGV